MARTLIRGGHILSMDPTIGELPKGDVLIADGVIAQVAPAISCEDAEVIDAADMLVCPGFVDTHRHTWQTSLRGLASDYTLSDYLIKIRLGYGAFYTPEDVYVGNYAGALEALNAGVTTLADHCHILNSPEHADAALSGLQDAGGRAVFCYGLFASPKHHPFRPDDSQGDWRRGDARRIRETILAGDHGLIRMGFAPAEVELGQFAIAADEIRFARELEAVVISCHAAMGGHSRFVDPSFVVNLTKSRLLGPDVLIVHGNSLTRYELGVLRDYGASISSIPEVEIQMGMGRPIIGAALKAGVQVGLGVDIVSNIAGDMFHQMRSALLEERGQNNDELVRRAEVPRRLDIDCRDVVRLATLGGAECLRLDSEVGSLAPGKQADVICVRRDSLGTMGARDVESILVHYATPQDVEHVWVGGRLVKQHGALVGVDVKNIVNRVRQSRERLEREMESVDIETLRGVMRFKNYGN